MLVIGGGVTGCGIALDAASRGLRTALVEAGDFAQGTSSRSSSDVLPAMGHDCPEPRAPTHGTGAITRQLTAELASATPSSPMASAG